MEPPGASSPTTAPPASSDPTSDGHVLKLGMKSLVTAFVVSVVFHYVD
jgi:hypothetical protein